MLADKKIAIVYDWIDKWGGVERVLQVLHKMFPQAVFYSSYFDPKGASWAKKYTIKTSFIQKLPLFIKKNRILSLPFYPFAFESFNFKDYDLVISISSSFAKGVVTRPETTHICYLLTPTRFLWLYPELYINTRVKKLLSSCLAEQIRRWDFVAAQRPDRIISISKTTAQRCRKYYQRNSSVIYPPFDIDYWRRIKRSIFNQPRFDNSSYINKQLKENLLNNKKFFLIVSRLEPYKKIGMVIKTWRHLTDWQLIIVGSGKLETHFKKNAPAGVYFQKNLTDQQLGWLYKNSQAVIIPQEEDFGYVSLEAQMFGCPIIAYKKGGATETVEEGKTGLFFDSQNEQALKKALAKFHTISYNLKTRTEKLGSENVRRFELKRFKKMFLELITELVG